MKPLLAHQIQKIQTLYACLVENANSGHPGAPITLASLFTHLATHIHFHPNQPYHTARDVLILSNGHACLLLYFYLHMTHRLSFNDLLSFRKVDSKTPGHPESLTKGVEVCTGPLGQGVSNSVGFAISQLKLFNEIVDDLKANAKSGDKFGKNDDTKNTCDLCKGKGCDEEKANKCDLCDKKNTSKCDDKCSCNLNDKGCSSNNCKTNHFVKMAAKIYSPITICVFGDGCYQEGLSQESFSIACHQDLFNLIYIYDCNKTTIDGSTTLSASDDIVLRFKALKFDVDECNIIDDKNGEDKVKACLDERIKKVRNTYAGFDNLTKPYVLILHTKIAINTLLEGNAKAHGAPLGEKAIQDMKTKYEIKDGLKIEQEVYDWYNEIITNNIKRCDQWAEDFKHSNLTEKLKERLLSNDQYKYNINLKAVLTKPQTENMATRKHMNQILNQAHPHLPYLISSSADLASSCLTKLGDDFNPLNRLGSYINFGIREHAMLAVCVGISAHGFYLPLASTFLNFVTYGFPALRLACLGKFKLIVIATHDSIGLGEDGPTHQPIEVIALMRATPNLLCFRPCDGEEVKGVVVVMAGLGSPVVVCLSRQSMKFCGGRSELVKFGAYLIYEGDGDNDDGDGDDKIKRCESEKCDSVVYDVNKFNNKPVITFLATGSEVSLCIEVAKELNARVVSMVCFELFEKQSLEYKNELLTGFVVSVEAGSTVGWGKYADYSIGLDRYGLSGKANDVFKFFGFTIDSVKSRVMARYKQWMEMGSKYKRWM